jgi:hypothetical protein
VPAVRGRVGDGRTSTSVGFARRKAEVRSPRRSLRSGVATRRISSVEAQRSDLPFMARGAAGE